MKQLIFTMLFFLCLGNLSAQVDKEFWFVAPEASSLHGDQPIYLRLSGLGTTATVTISQPADPTFPVITQTVGANALTSVNLTPYLNKIENKPANNILTKGLLIQSTVDINAYYEIGSGVNPEIFPLKGRNALGTEFYIPAQNLYNNQVGSGAFDIVATENGTIITIIPNGNIVGHSAGVPFTITLNKGETFSCRETNTGAAGHLGGSKITSNKPIAVTINDDSLFSLGAWDIIGDQLVSTNLIGEEYIAVKGLGADERVFVLATKDQTDVFINNSATPIITLNEGQLYAASISGQSIYIKTSQPVYAYHLSGHQGELGDAVLPPITCTGSDLVRFIRPGNDQFSMMLLTEANNQNNFLLNGATLNASFQPVPGNANWVAALINPSTALVSSGQNTLTNTGGLFHLGILYNYGGLSSEYGYFSNYSSLNIGDDRVICEGEQLILDAGYDKNSYLWNTGDTTRSITVMLADTYSIAANYYNCLLRDTIILQVNAISVDLGGDLAMCADSDTLFIANTPNQEVTYEWHDGSIDSFYLAADTGQVLVTITDTLGCEATDSMLFSYYPVIDLGNDTSFVCDSLVFTIVSNLTNATYLWQDGSTDSFLTVYSDGRFYVDVIDENGCFSSDTLYTAFVVSPVLNLGNDTTVCPDQLVTFDGAIPGGIGYLWQDSTTTANYSTDTAGVFIVRAVDSTTCYTWDTVIVSHFQVPDSLFEGDTLLCNDETLTLEPDISNPSSFLWQDGSTGNSYFVDQQNLYYVEVLDDNGCYISDTINVSYLNDPSNSNLPTDTTVCFRNPITLDATQDSAIAYQWRGYSTYYGENDYNAPTFLVKVAGTYEVDITNPCGTITRTIEVVNENCDCEPFIPNGFTPNNDGNNDKLEIFAACEIIDPEFSVFDEDGTLIYFTKDITQGWDGRFRGKIMHNGVYMWQIKFSAANKMGVVEEKILVGDVTLVR